MAAMIVSMMRKMPKGCRPSQSFVSMTAVSFPTDFQKYSKLITYEYQERWLGERLGAESQLTKELPQGAGRSVQAALL
jgi:hypothetical protein